jgi:hypothetical protein
MGTRSSTARLLAGAAAIAVAALLAGTIAASGASSRAPVAPGLGLDPAQQGDLNLVPAADTPKTTVDQAYQAALKEYDWDLAPGDPTFEAGLAMLSIPASGGVVDSREVWVIHISGLKQWVDGPMSPDGALPGRTLSNAYVLIDADSGEYLMTSWTE